MKITLYSTPSCKYCFQAKDFFKKHDIKYDEINVRDNMRAREYMIQMSGQRSVPVITVDGNTYIGFSEEKFAFLL